MDEVRVAGFDEIGKSTLYGILRLRGEVFVVEQACPYQDIDGRDMEPGTVHVWVPRDGAEILAYLRILSEPDGTARIGRVVVSPRARRRGHAAALLARAVEVIGDRPAVLDAQSYATDLYARAGFAPAGPEFIEDGIPHIPMRRPALPR